MVCCICAMIHSAYLLINWQIEAFMMCGVFVLYLLFALMQQTNEGSN